MEVSKQWPKRARHRSLKADLNAIAEEIAKLKAKKISSVRSSKLTQKTKGRRLDVCRRGTKRKASEELERVLEHENSSLKRSAPPKRISVQSEPMEVGSCSETLCASDSLAGGGPPEPSPPNKDEEVNHKCFEALCRQLPGRKNQLQVLLYMFSELPMSCVYPVFYLYGCSATGKTLTLRTVLRALEVPMVYVMCTECCNLRLLFEEILNQLSNHLPCSLNGYSGWARCDSLASFVQLLPKAAEARDCQGMRFSEEFLYIVLDGAERLKELDACSLLPALLRLRELSGVRVCLVLVGELAWECFLADAGGPRPFAVHFPNYTKEEALQIMSLDCPPNWPLPFYMTFCHHIWNVFSHVCRCVRELRHLSTMLFSKYCEPVVSSKVGSSETRKLWNHIQPYLRTVTSKLYLRELASTQWKKGAAQESLNSFQYSHKDVQAALELPYHSKFLLISCYLASYNPAKSDQKFFSKISRRKPKKVVLQGKIEKSRHHLVGPKPFSLDRMMAIFYSTVEHPIRPSVDLFCQISTLAALQLVASVGDSLDSPKYKCLVTLDYIRSVSRSVGFDVLGYLYDFV